jgi:hypothetical protein
MGRTVVYVGTLPTSMENVDTSMAVFTSGIWENLNLVDRS